MEMTVFQFGFRFGLGVITAISLVMFLASLVGWVMNRTMPIDATDRSKTERSDLALKTDYGTGLQYLETKGGGITPRLGPDGKHMRTGAKP